MIGGRLFSAGTAFFELTKYLFIAIVIIATLIVFVGTPLMVRGESMLPTFRSGNLVIVERLSYVGNRSIIRGDMVAARFPADPSGTRLIKRVVGLPGERIVAAGGQILINSEPLVENQTIILGAPSYVEAAEVTLKEGEYFLVGDNRPQSSDSRLWGPVQRQDILGRVSFVIFPLPEARYVGTPY